MNAKLYITSTLIFFHVNLNSFFFSQIKKPFTIILDPSADFKKKGRLINNEYENNLTLKFAHNLKKIIESRYLNVRVILTRTASEDIVIPLQNANFANQLNVDLYLNVNFYQEKETVPEVFFYYYLTEPFFVSSSIKLYFYNFDCAHLINISSTLEYCKKFENIFNNKIYNDQFNFKGFFGIPFKQLVGIKAPSIAFEMGIKNEQTMNDFINPIIEAIGQIIQ